MFRPNESLYCFLVLGVFTASCDTSYTPLAGTGGASFDTGGFATEPGGAGSGAFPAGAGGAPPNGGNGAAGTPIGGGAVPTGGGAGPIGGAGFVSSTGGTMGVAGSGEMTASGGGGGAPPIGAGGTPVGAGGMPPMPSCPATPLPPGTTNGSIQFGGTTRTYVLHVPTSYTGKTPVPLVTDWHPILFTDTFEQGISGYQAKSDQEGFIVVWPQGIDNAWNVGPCCTTSRTVDDVGFARAVITKIESQACIDTKRVYAVGYSMGGGMSLDLACNAADIIAAISPAAFDLMADSNNWPCHPSRPISVVDFRSTTDPIVPYAGGATNPPNGLPVVVTFLGAQATFQKFAQLDQCTGSPASDAVGTGCQTYSQCAQGVQVTLCTKQGGGHDPGDPAVAWNVLKKYTLP